MTLAISIKKLLKLIMYIIIFEAILGGAGRTIAFGPLSIRMVLFVIAFLLMFILWALNKFDIKQFKLNNIFTKLIIVFLVYTLITGVHGYYFAHHSLSLVIGDVTGYIAFLLIFIFNIAIEDKYEIKRISILTIFATFLQSISLIIIHLFLGLGIFTFDGINTLLQQYYIGNLSYIAPNTIRIFFKSSLFLQIGFILLLAFISKERNKKNLIIEYIVLIFISYAIVLSFTRGFWIGAVLSFIIMIFCKHAKPLGKTLLVLIVGVSIMLAITCAAYRNTDVLVSLVQRTGLIKQSTIMMIQNKQLPTGDTDGQDLSAEYRSQESKYLVKYIEKSPIIGTGFGTIITELNRNNSRNEYMYLDIWMEMGLIGLILFGSILILVFKHWIKIRRRNVNDKDLVYLDAIIAALAGVVVTSGINPFLNNPIGLTYLVFTITAVNVYRKDS
jgi:O-antigen ligase